MVYKISKKTRIINKKQINKKKLKKVKKNHAK